MRKLRIFIAVTLLGTLTVAGSPSWSQESAPPVAPADTVLVNGGIYTVDARRSWAQAVAIQGGRIVAVGSNDDIKAHVGPATRVIDLTGRLALPGFHDSHVHVADSGLEELQCPLYGLTSVEATLAAVAECARNTQAQWLTGGGWDLSLFERTGPSKALLDKIVPDRPVMLLGADGHSGWVNSKALELAGLSYETPDPPNGVIERDARTGELTGTLRESANDLIQRHIPPVDSATRLAGLRRGLSHANAAGITSFIEAAAGEAELDAFQALARSGELTARVVVSITYDPLGSADFEELLARRKEFSGPRLNADAVKIFIDGVLEGETAALLAPYLTHPDRVGPMNLTPAALADAVTRFDSMGLQVHMHAIGDAAVRAGLDAVAAARIRNGPSDGRHHIAHLQLVHPDDIPRFAALGVTANFQALWAWPDDYILKLNLPDVGANRVNRMYPIGSVHRAGGRIVGGSDWSVSSINPLLAIQVALTRQDPDGKRPAVLNEKERVDLPTMIAAYTIEGAWLMHHEQQTGSIEIGKAADFVVLDRDIFKLPPGQVGSAGVVMTLLDGATVYQHSAAKDANAASSTPESAAPRPD